MSLMDQPLPILFVGLVTTAALVGGMLRTGRMALLYASILAAVATLGLLALERMVVTPREEVKATLHVIAALLQQNDPARVVEYISEGRPRLREEARHKLGLVEILEVKIKRNLTVDVVCQRGMEVAEARFNAVIRVRDRRGIIAERQVPQFFSVTFRREDGVWRVRSYKMDDPRRGI